MSRKFLWIALALAPFALAPLLAAQEGGGKSGRIDVNHYAIDADINPRTQTLSANVKVQLVALDNDIASASFELNSAFNVSRVVDDSGHQITASRSGQNMNVQVSFPAPLVKGKATTLTFTYDGRLTGQEDSPVLRHQVRRHPERHHVPDVPGALVSGEWLQRGSIYVGSSYHGATGYQVIASGVGTSQPARG